MTKPDRGASRVGLDESSARDRRACEPASLRGDRPRRRAACRAAPAWCEPPERDGREGAVSQPEKLDRSRTGSPGSPNGRPRSGARAPIGRRIRASAARQQKFVGDGDAAEHEYSWCQPNDRAGPDSVLVASHRVSPSHMACSVVNDARCWRASARIVASSDMRPPPARAERSGRRNPSPVTRFASQFERGWCGGGRRVRPGGRRGCAVGGLPPLAGGWRGRRWPGSPDSARLTRVMLWVSPWASYNRPLAKFQGPMFSGSSCSQ